MQHDKQMVPDGVAEEKRLPPGTYPATGAPPATGQMPEGTAPMFEEKPRRIGLVTMALALIAAGVLMVLRIFVPGLDYATILRFSPVILIFLGVELLVALAVHRNKKIRLDVASTLVSLLLIGISLVAAVMPEVIYTQYASNQANTRIEAQLRQASYQLSNSESLPKVELIEWYVNVAQTTDAEDKDYTDLVSEDYTQVRVYLAGSYEDATTFAADCHVMVQALRGLVYDLDYIIFEPLEYASAEDGALRFTLWLQGPWMMDEDAAAMAERVETERWFAPYAAYLPLGEYEEAEERHEQELAYEAWRTEIEELNIQLGDLQEQASWKESEVYDQEYQLEDAAPEQVEQMEAQLETLRDEHEALLDEIETLQELISELEAAQPQ